MRLLVVRTHGGLGNQLFQIFYARLITRRIQAIPFEVHDLRYPHRFQRSSELKRYPPPPLMQQAISAVRIPKILSRIGPSIEALNLMNTTYLDGYFQRAQDYEHFNDQMLREELMHLRAELKVSHPPRQEFAMHLRLGDFFTSDTEVAEHLAHRLANLDNHAKIITNEESRLNSPEIAKILESKYAKIIPTKDMTPEQVLRSLASFQKVDGNDSTLLFWASVLSGTDCEFQNPNLRALRERFLDVQKDFTDSIQVE